MIENGAGASPSGNGTSPGVGITGMRERATAIGGTLARRSARRRVPASHAELPYEPSR